MLEYTLSRIPVTSSRIKNWIPQLTEVSINQSPESTAQCLKSSVQGPASTVQRLASRFQSPVSRVQFPESCVQSPSSRVQHPESSAQSTVSRVQRLESSIQSPASNTCVQSPGIPVLPWQCHIPVIKVLDFIKS